MIDFSHQAMIAWANRMLDYVYYEPTWLEIGERVSDIAQQMQKDHLTYAEAQYLWAKARKALIAEHKTHLQ